MKRIIALLLALTMAASLMGCMIGADKEEEATEPATEAPTEPPKKSIHVLLPADTEGWQAAAAASAGAAAETVQATGNYEVTVATYANAEEQVGLLENIAAQSAKDGMMGVVTMPAGEEAADALAKLLDANVAYALADLIPETAAAASVANVCYDQQQIGAAAAAYLVENGLTQKQKVVIIQGLSEDEAQRTEGFKLYLQGKMAVNGATIETSWTSLENIVYSDMQGDTQDSAEVYFDTYMESKDHAETKYIAAWDDAYVLGILEALEGETIDSKIKQTFLDGKPFITGCGGSQAMLDVLAGNSQYTNLDSLGGIQTMVYSQDLLTAALQAMTGYFDGTVVEQDQNQPIVWATAENAGQFKGY